MGMVLAVVAHTTIRSRILKESHSGQSSLWLWVAHTTIRSRILKAEPQTKSHPVLLRCTHHDPFEDTESELATEVAVVAEVAHTTIRSRILKDWEHATNSGRPRRCTHHDPFEDTERGLNRGGRGEKCCCTHHDPFEDTERSSVNVSTF